MKRGPCSTYEQKPHRRQLMPAAEEDRFRIVERLPEYDPDER